MRRSRRARRDPRIIPAVAAALLLLLVAGIAVVMFRPGPASDEPEDTFENRRPIDTSLMPTQYTVESGETLSDIAVKLDVPVEALRAVNDLGNSDLVEPGQVLIVPPSGILVQEADPALTIRELARLYDLAPFTVAAYNGIVRDLVDVPLGRNVVIVPDDSSRLRTEP